MSAQVAVVPAATNVRASLKPVSTSRPSSSGSKVAAKLSRLRQAPPKPEIEVDKAELKKSGLLTPIQYKVTQEKFTERAFSGEYVKLNDAGKYCCIVCGVEIFSSDTKFDSGCGWPSFADVIDSKKVIQQADLSHVGGNLLLLALNQDLARIEVSCARCGAHLGHVFDDGPKPTGRRYCVNSASLRFKKTDHQKLDDSKQTDTDLTPACALQTASASGPCKLSEPKKQAVPAVASSLSQECKSSAAQSPSTGDQGNVKQGATQLPPSISTEISKEEKKSTKPSGSTWRVEWRRPGKLFSGSSNKSSQQKTNVNPGESVTGVSDANNNRIEPKYESVKSRYLNHLDSVSKQEVERHTSRKPIPDNRPLLETHL